MSKEKVAAIILAGGAGLRMETVTPKQFLRIAGKAIVIHTLLQFERNPNITDIVVVCPQGYKEELKQLIQKEGLKKIYKITAAGKTRQESSWHGLKNCPKGTKYVLIHDAVRPFVTDKIIDDTLAAAKEVGASDTVIDTADTIIEEKNGLIKNIPDRAHLKRGQTPQGFNYPTIKDAHQWAKKNNIENSTDDCRLVLLQGKPVKIVPGSIYNIKLTDQTDLYLAERLFQLKQKNLGPADYRLLHGKIAVVFGGRGGIGENVVTLLKKYGCQAIAVSRATEIKCDVQSEISVKECFRGILQKYKKIDIVVNSVGLLKMSRVETMNLADWEEIISVNLTGAFLISKYAIPILKKNREGHIVHVVSSSYTRGRMNYSAYSASKAALVNFVQALADEVMENNIYVNAISPQRVATKMRSANFGEESGEALVSPLEVAQEIVNYCIVKETGHIVDVRAQK